MRVGTIFATWVKLAHILRCEVMVKILQGWLLLLERLKKSSETAFSPGLCRGEDLQEATREARRTQNLTCAVPQN